MVMIGAVVGVLYFLDHRADPGAFTGFLLMFILLFLTTGIGNGSTFRMIPIIFANKRQREAGATDGAARDEAMRRAAKDSAAVLGFTSAIAAYGAFIIPQCYGLSIQNTGGPQAALYGFIVFYATCVVVTWWFYSRRRAEAPC